jgi:hypothetical protein
MSGTGLTLIEWYIQRERKFLAQKPEEAKRLFSDWLKYQPDSFLNCVLENLEEDLLKACVSGELANPIVCVNDVTLHAQEVLEAFQKEFILN